MSWSVSEGVGSGCCWRVRIGAGDFGTYACNLEAVRE